MNIMYLIKVHFKAIAICLLLLGCSMSSAQSPFSNALYDSYKAAFDMNEEGRYLEAYRTMNTVRNLMNEEMRGKTVAMLSEDDFLNFWWPVNRSIAEIAYRLGLHDIMLSVADEMDSALSIFKISDGNYYAQLLKLDAGRHFLTGELYVAEFELNRALALASPYESSFISDLHDELAQLYYRQKKYAMALLQLDSVIPNPELAGQRALCLAQMGNYADALALLNSQRPKANSQKPKLLRQKAKVLMLQYDATGVYNPKARQYYNDYLSQSRSFIESHFIEMTEAEREQYWMAEQPFMTDCYRLEDKDPTLLYDIALYSKALLLNIGRKFKSDMKPAERKKVLSSIHVTWKEVQRRLPDTAVAIEFIVYERNQTDHIGALLLRKQGKPQFVHVISLDSLLSHTLTNGMTVGEAMPNTIDPDVIDALYVDTTLHKLLWNDTLMRLLGNVKTIYFAPDGILHRIGIEYMLQGRNLYRLTSTRMLVEARRKIRTDSMLLLGGIDYQNEKTDVEPGHEVKANDQLAYQLLAPLKMKLPPLSGTKSEVEAVKALRDGKENKLLVADSATESALRNLIGKYHIVLLSTHGWMDDVTQIGSELRPATTDAQLSQSCIFLSGAEKNLRDTTFDAEHLDGILSAREMASMDLSEVDLAVLSACVSGLGYITPDGVYGLQRGLKTAGVHAVIASLWDVNDFATSFLIKNLYANLEQNMTLHDAFSKAQSQLASYVRKQRLRGRYSITKYDRPYYINAFILIDGIE